MIGPAVVTMPEGIVKGPDRRLPKNSVVKETPLLLAVGGMGPLYRLPPAAAGGRAQTRRSKTWLTLRRLPERPSFFRGPDLSVITKR